MEKLNSKWEELLKAIDNSAININRVEKVNSVTGEEAYQYVKRALDILDSYEKNYIKNPSNIDPYYCNIGKVTKEYYVDVLREVLQWMDVSKSSGVTAMHDIVSANIYRAHTKDNFTDRNALIEKLSSIHGVIGQAIQGEFNEFDLNVFFGATMEKNKPETAKFTYENE